MNKLKLVATVLLALFSISFIEKGAKLSTGLSEGSNAPSIQLDGFNLTATRGQKVLLVFWAAYDAESRLKNVLYSANLQKIPSEIKFVSIGFDESPLIFGETVRIDKLDGSTQYHDRNGKTSEIFRAYRLKEGFGSYLLDENGVIIAKNLDPKKLGELMSLN